MTTPINLGALQSAAFMMEGLHDAGYDAAIQAYQLGCLELVTELVEYAPIIDRACEALSSEVEGFPGVFEYEVSAPFGRWFGEQVIQNYYVPEKTDALQHVTMLLQRFFMQSFEGKEAARISAFVAAVMRQLAMEQPR